jgi:NAD(P)-dependent dehydrogenase (short-subunit alcohol dehydrogenase family)
MKSRASSSVVLITGADGGLGAALVQHFSTMGAQVVATDLCGEEASVGPRAGRRLDNVRWLQADITSAEDVGRLFATIETEYGQLDALVNNASIYRNLDPKQRFEDVAASEFDSVMRVNVRGTWQVISGALPLMKQKGTGRIINVSSATSRLGVPGFPHYVASKAAVEGLTRAAARELGVFGIRVNCVAPGLISTDATLERNARAEISNAAALRSVARELFPQDLLGTFSWLASEDSSPVTGQTIMLDGGQHFV